MIRVADYVVKRLQQAGVSHVFYVPGGQCVYLMDALRRSQDVRSYGMHHEQAVAMAALSYATLNETLGAGIVTTGCAGTNTMTGLLHAWQDSIPLIIVSGQQNWHETVRASGLPLRQVGIQEADITAIVGPVTKYAVTVQHPEEIAWHLDKALHLAMSGRKGPVWVDLPLNVQNAMVKEETLERYVPKDQSPKIQDQDLQRIIGFIKDAKRPVLLAGNGVRSAGARAELKAVCEKFRLPVVFSRLAADLLPFDHPQNFGLIGGVAGANRYANFTVQNSDLVLAVGSRLSIEVTGPSRRDFAREARIVVIDTDRTEHCKDGVRIDLFAHADARDFLARLATLDLPKVPEEWFEKCRHWKEIFAYSLTHAVDAPVDTKIFMTAVSEAAPDGTVFMSDAGFTGAAAPAATHLKPHDRFVMALSQGEMGYALPGALGVAPLAKGAVISYSGDGSVMMNLQELQTLYRNQFNVKAHFRGKSFGTDPSNGLTFPSFEKVAAAFGISYLKIANYADFSKIPEIFASDKPLVVEVITDPDQFDLHNGLVMYGKRKFGFRPIEDQSPYLDRELFFKEMIVKPLETSSGTPV